MRVCLDLMLKGYEVYRAAFSGMTCDLYVCGKSTWLYPGSIPQRVEVMSGNYSPNGTLVYPPKKNPDNYDIAAVVVGDVIVYIPEL